MARKIEGPFDFSDNNFAQYADGATWILVKGEDYQVTSKTLVTNARRWARSQGLAPEHKYLDANPESVALRFSPSNVTTNRPRETEDGSAMVSHFEALVREKPAKAKAIINGFIREFNKTVF